jgi:hypothetical protein
MGQSIRQSSMVIVIIEQSIRHNQWARALSIINALAPSWRRQSQKVLFRTSHYALPYDIFRALYQSAPNTGIMALPNVNSKKVLFRASYYALPYDIFRALKSKCSEHRHYQMSMTSRPKPQSQCHVSPCRPKLQSQCHVRPWAKHEDNAIALSS